MPDEDLYRELQRSLDEMPVGFPAAASGVEIRILRHLFTPDEARLALALSAIPEPLSAIRKRIGPDQSTEAIREALDRMAKKGLIERRAAAGEPRYGKSLFVVGIYERQLNRMTQEFARDVLQYFDESFGPAVHTTKTPQMRTIPVNQAIEPQRGIGRYDDIRKFVQDSEGPFAAMDCICRQTKGLIGEECRRTGAEPNCLTFGAAARSLAVSGSARLVSREEMLALLERADRDGLVLQPQNTQNPLFVCCCCGCCCAVLTTAKKLPRPAEYFSTNYHAQAEATLCQGCGVCVTRCPMDSISLDGTSRIDLTRCIGCGLCASTCPSGAIHLHRKEKQTVPPKDTLALYGRIYRERYGAWGMARALSRNVLGLKA